MRSRLLTLVRIGSIARCFSPPHPDTAATVPGNNALGRITAAGVVTGETPITEANAFNTPEFLTLGPDGNLGLDLAGGTVVQATLGATSPSPTPTVTIVSASPTATTVDHAVRVTAVVTPQGQGMGTVAGKVKFDVDGRAQAPVTSSDVNGVEDAVLSLATLSVGTHMVSTSYGGTPVFHPARAPRRR